jgi:hypothetical protein
VGFFVVQVRENQIWCGAYLYRGAVSFGCRETRHAAYKLRDSITDEQYFAAKVFSQSQSVWYFARPCWQWRTFNDIPSHPPESQRYKYGLALCICEEKQNPLCEVWQHQNGRT